MRKDNIIVLTHGIFHIIAKKTGKVTVPWFIARFFLPLALCDVCDNLYNFEKQFAYTIEYKVFRPQWSSKKRLMYVYKHKEKWMCESNRLQKWLYWRSL